MNSTDEPALVAELTAQVYQGFVYEFIHFSCLALLLYTAVLAFDQEIKYIWLKSPSLPNSLYVLARYGLLINEAFLVWLFFLPPGSLCNTVANITSAGEDLGYAGIQGLLITRAYSLCQGNKLIVGCLVLLFLGGFVLPIADIALFPGCFVLTPSTSSLSKKITLPSNICVILTDVLVLGVTLWAVWGTWKLRRETGVGGSTNSLASILLNQTLARFCFVCLITVGSSIAYQLKADEVSSALNTFQNALSSILTADGLLHLREQNSAAIETRNATLPSIRFGTMFQRIHESIITEMGDHGTETDESEEDINEAEQSTNADAVTQTADVDSSNLETVHHPDETASA